MNRERYLEIVSAYGADSTHWPADERDAALALRAADPSLDAPTLREAQLDDVLDAYHARVSSNLAMDILNRRPRSLAERVLEWLMPEQYGAFAASILLAAGILIGSATTSQDEAFTASDLEDELYLLALDEYPYFDASGQPGQ